MKKNKRKISLFRKILRCLLVLLLLLFCTLHMSISFCVTDANNEYDTVLNTNIKSTSNPLIKDIAVLGAHDAFTCDLKQTNEADKNDSMYGVFNNAFVKTLGGGLITRLSRAQAHSVKELLYAGVRYLDVRVSLVDGKYYTTHGLLAGNLEDYVKDVVDFLENHPGEYIIFDIQHFDAEEHGVQYRDTNGNSHNKDLFDDLFTFLSNIKNSSNKSIFDYIPYTNSTAINELTYNDVTSNRASSGVVMMAKCCHNDKVYFRDGDAGDDQTSFNSVRSLWHNKNDDDLMIQLIDQEMNFVKDNHLQDSYLIINQAQETGFITNLSIVNSLNRWSLLNMANTYNAKLVKDKTKFMSWLEYMPIFMVDYATSNYGNFNKLANTYIAEYNSLL